MKPAQDHLDRNRVQMFLMPYEVYCNHRAVWFGMGTMAGIILFAARDIILNI